MSSVSDSGCGCEPCPVDMRNFGYRAEWEDPQFRGKQCKWHLHIQGTYGCVSPDVSDGEPSLFVQFYRRPWSMSSPEWERIKDLGCQFTVDVSELRVWAKAIGAKRR